MTSSPTDADIVWEKDAEGQGVLARCSPWGGKEVQPGE